MTPPDEWTQLLALLRSLSKDLSMPALAKRTGYSEAQLRRWLSGKTKQPRDSTVEDLKKKLTFHQDGAVRVLVSASPGEMECLESACSELRSSLARWGYISVLGDPELARTETQQLTYKARLRLDSDCGIMSCELIDPMNIVVPVSLEETSGDGLSKSDLFASQIALMVHQKAMEHAAKSVKEIDSPWVHVLAGARSFHLMTKPGLASARPHLERARDLDPNHVYAKLYLALLEWFECRLGFSKDRKAAQQRASDLVKDATSLSPQDAYVYVLQGLIRLMERDRTGVLNAFSKAVSKNPNLGIARALLAEQQAVMGDHASARRELELAGILMQNDPLPWQLNSATCMIHFAADAIDDAVTFGKEAVLMASRYVAPYIVLAASYNLQGNTSEAEKIAATIREEWPDLTFDDLLDLVANTPSALQKRLRKGLSGIGLGESPSRNKKPRA